MNTCRVQRSFLLMSFPGCACDLLSKNVIDAIDAKENGNGQDE